MSRKKDPTAADEPADAVSAALRGVARLKTAGADPVPLSGAVAAGLSSLAPGSSVAVLSVDPMRLHVQVLATGGLATLIVSANQAQKAGSFIVDCARQPLTVLSIAGDAAAKQFQTGSAGGIRLTTILGITVPVGASSTWILLLGLPADAAVAAVQENLRVFARILCSMLRLAASEDTAEGISDSIKRAKDEWELTADTLPHIVCLLDAAGRVLRANRTVERWSLGRVEQAPGRNFHDLLHPDCSEPNCRLQNGVATAYQRMQSEKRRAYEFQLTDRQLGRVIKIRLGRMLAPHTVEPASTAVCAVLVVQDVTEMATAQQKLATMNSELEIRVEERTRDLAGSNRELENEVARRASVEEELRAKSSELAALSAGLMNAQEQERKRISRELHDSVGQSLNALKYGLERAAELERQGRRTGTLDSLNKSIATIQETMNEIRNIALDLRPSVLDDLGAASAVTWFCRAFASSYPDLEVVPNISARDEQVPARLATTIFRSLQELLNNVSRHAKAKEVEVSLKLDAGQVILEVKDDGVGLKGPAAAPGARQGHGMRNLRERADLTGGTFELKSGKPKGALARICWSLSAGEGQRVPGADQTVGEGK
ncbi:MAG: histidine kinase [Steroidobacteraceae bacterium]